MNNVFKLNVGGVIHSTTISTLCRSQNSMLARMFSGQLPPSQTLDSNGNIFIDRDGHLFEYILNYLRSGVLTLPSDFKSFKGLLVEADFFGLDELLEAIKQSQQNSRNRIMPNGDQESSSNYILEITEFEESQTFERFYSTQQSQIHSSYGGLVISGHRDVLSSLGLLSTPIESESSEFNSVCVSSYRKMEIFHQLARDHWTLHRADLKYTSPNCATNNLIRLYIWMRQ